MKKVDWEEVSDITLAICMGLLISLAPMSGLLILMSLHDNYPPIKWIGYSCLGIMIASIIVACITSFIGFIRNRKKNKKQKYVQPKVVITEDIVV